MTCRRKRQPAQRRIVRPVASRGGNRTCASGRLLHCADEFPICRLFNVSETDRDEQQVLPLLRLNLQLRPSEAIVLFGRLLGRASSECPPPERRRD